MQDIKLGSCFSGIGGFELGLHWAIPNLKTIWQCEQDKFCQKILKKHWPQSLIYEDITTIKTSDLEEIDILCGGFPCQNISIAGKGEGLYGKKSGLFWEMLRIISDFRDQGRKIPILLLENVPAITLPGRGLRSVLGSLSQIGYSVEYFPLKACDFGAPHKRERWFAIAYPNTRRKKNTLCTKRKEPSLQIASPYSIGERQQNKPVYTLKMEEKDRFKCTNSKNGRENRENYWKKGTSEPGLCSLDDGIPQRVARLKALGNAIVPQCSQWIGERLIETGLIEDILGEEYVY